MNARKVTEYHPTRHLSWTTEVKLNYTLIKIIGDRPRQPANRNCCSLSCVSSALAQISCSVSGKELQLEKDRDFCSVSAFSWTFQTFKFMYSNAGLWTVNVGLQGRIRFCELIEKVS